MRGYRLGLRVLPGLLLGLFLVTSVHAGGPAFTRLFAPAETAQTSYLNPAGMARIDGSAFAGQLIYGTRFSSFNVDDSVTTNTGGDPRDQDPVIVPSLYYVRPIFGDDWRLGLTLNAPGGFGTGNGPNWAGRYYSDQFSLIFLAATATLARRVTPWLSLGGGVSYQYSSTEATTQALNPNPGDPDAKLEVDADGADFGYIASALFDLSDRTRFGVTWHSETDPDESTNVDLKRSTLPPPIVDAIEDAGNNTNAALRTPQHIDLGLYHEWDNGWSATVDAIWVDFSRFGLTELRVDGNNLDVPDSNFKDFWIVTAGVEYPLADNLDGRLGLLYFEQPVSNEDRTFSFALDNAWGVGGGVNYTRRNGSRIDFNGTMIRTDDAPIDTGVASALEPRGRVAGKNGSSPWALAIEFTYHWARPRL
jgi:long-chain fatty acid transport protein